MPWETNPVIQRMTKTTGWNYLIQNTNDPKTLATANTKLIDLRTFAMLWLKAHE